jgi:hypothetical protein
MNFSGVISSLLSSFTRSQFYQANLPHLLIKTYLSIFSGATLHVDAGISLYSPQMWQIDEHEKIPEYNWNPYGGEEGEGSVSEGQPEMKPGGITKHVVYLQVRLKSIMV